MIGGGVHQAGLCRHAGQEQGIRVEGDHGAVEEEGGEDQQQTEDGLENSVVKIRDGGGLRVETKFAHEATQRSQEPRHS